MSKIDFKGEEIKGKIIPKLSDAIDHLSSVIEIESDMRIPLDFKYADYMKELCNKNKKSRNEISEIKEWLIKSNRELSNAVQQIQYNTDRIDRINLSVINSRIK